MLNITLQPITFIGSLQETECYNIWFVAGFVFFLLICLVIFNEIKSKKIKQLEKFILTQEKDIENFENTILDFNEKAKEIFEEEFK